MRNVFFNKEILLENALYFVCSMIGLIARNIKQLNDSVVNKIGNKEAVYSYKHFQFISYGHFVKDFKSITYTL